jgi:RecB family endonuclease NucS
MKQATKQKTDKKIVIEHLFKAIATMRSQQGPNSAKGQVQRVVEILKRDYGVSVPGSLRKTIGRCLGQGHL